LSNLASNGFYIEEVKRNNNKRGILGEFLGCWDLRLGPVRFLSAGGGGNAKFSQGFPGGRVYPVKYLGFSSVCGDPSSKLPILILEGLCDVSSPENKQR